MNIKKIIFLIVVVLLVGFIGWKLFANKKVVDARTEQVAEVSFAIPVKTEIAKKEDISQKQLLTGVFEANEIISLIAETQGIVRKISVEEGSAISKNGLVLKVDDASLQSQMTSAKASLEKAKKDLERYKKLETAGAVSTQQIEEKELGVKNAEANMEAINQQLSFTYVKSPINGFVNEVLVEEGEFVMPGTKVAEVLNVERLKFIILVSESDLNIMKEGSKVNIKTDAYPLNTYTGKVAHISYKADKSKKYKVTIEVSNDKNNPLRAGMFGKATFNENNQSQSAIVIPRRSVIGSLKDAQVYVVDGNKVTLKNITVGAKLDDGIVVLKGLKVGERVVTNGQINLKDGVEIRIAD